MGKSVSAEGRVVVVKVVGGGVSVSYICQKSNEGGGSWVCCGIRQFGGKTCEVIGRSVIGVVGVDLLLGGIEDVCCAELIDAFFTYIFCCQ